MQYIRIPKLMTKRFQYLIFAYHRVNFNLTFAIICLHWTLHQSPFHELHVTLTFVRKYFFPEILGIQNSSSHTTLLSALVISPNWEKKNQNYVGLRYDLTKRNSSTIAPNKKEGTQSFQLAAKSKETHTKTINADCRRFHQKFNQEADIYIPMQWS